MSDYGHHPTEIQVTLRALKSAHPDKHLFVVFQPHQHSRTIELLEGFCESFDDADTLLIPDIYFSRDSQQDADAMPAELFVHHLQDRYPDTIYGDGLETTAHLLREYDQDMTDTIFLLLGAGDVDNLRDNFTI